MGLSITITINKKNTYRLQLTLDSRNITLKYEPFQHAYYGLYALVINAIMFLLVNMQFMFPSVLYSAITWENQMLIYF